MDGLFFYLPITDYHDLEFMIFFIIFFVIFFLARSLPLFSLYTNFTKTTSTIFTYAYKGGEEICFMHF